MSRLTNVFKKFPKTFWVANTMELFERWAWYGFYMILALYLTGSTDSGALGFTQAQKGNLMGPVTFLLYLLPIITGAIADRFGYKRVLIIAYIILSSGYFLLGQMNSYAGFYIVFIYLAIGAALFKPIITATISRTTDDETSSIGFGIFYMIVNIGAFIGPVFASKFRAIDWQYVFYMSSAIICINFILVLAFFKEPPRSDSNLDFVASIKKIGKNIVTVLADYRLVVFLLIIVGFWSMYLQLFYTLPVFIEQWMDTSTIYNALNNLSPTLAQAIGTPEHTIAPEMLTNIDALYIVIFQLAVSTVVMRFKPLRAMTAGILIAAIGVGLMFAFSNPFYLFASILIFGIGEMSTSPKTQEYIGKIAPPDKVALYMGYSYLPLAGGHFLAGFLSGSVYSGIADKATLLRTELIARGIAVPEISKTYTLNDFYTQSASLLQMDQKALTTFLWHQYHPYTIWMLYAGIGIGTFIALLLYDRLLMRRK
jgi:dipeptide/tripeptide permease